MYKPILRKLKILVLANRPEDTGLSQKDVRSLYKEIERLLKQHEEFNNIIKSVISAYNDI
jgi:hypothetical protein